MIAPTLSAARSATRRGNPARRRATDREGHLHAIESARLDTSPPPSGPTVPDAEPLTVPPGSTTFAFTGASQDWTVPPAVTSVRAAAFGLKTAEARRPGRVGERDGTSPGISSNLTLCRVFL